MSGIVKGIKKVFKAVVKVVKKVAVPLLAAGAIFFTGGAALGLPGIMGGGWSAAASAVGSTLGGSGIVGSVLTGAITQAGTGAVIGGAVSAATGGSFSEGMKRGAMAGAVTGGLSGALGHVNAAAQPKVTPHGGPPIGEAIEHGGGVKTFPVDIPRSTGGSLIDEAGNVIADTAGASAGGGRGLLSGIMKEGGWLERNQELVGGVVKGVGQGLLSGSAADADRDLLRERQQLTAANYGDADPGARYRDLAPGTSGQSPGERFGGYEYVYDRQQGRIVRQPINNG